MLRFILYIDLPSHCVCREESDDILYMGNTPAPDYTRRVSGSKSTKATPKSSQTTPKSRSTPKSSRTTPTSRQASTHTTPRSKRRVEEEDEEDGVSAAVSSLRLNTPGRGKEDRMEVDDESSQDVE